MGDVAPRYVGLDTLARMIDTGASTIEGWVRVGQFPQPRKVGGKRLWSWKEVERFIEHPTDNVLPIEQGRDIREATKRVSQGG